VVVGETFLSTHDNRVSQVARVCPVTGGTFVSAIAFRESSLVGVCLSLC
jgi:hypothetical protein